MLNLKIIKYSPNTFLTFTIFGFKKLHFENWSPQRFFCYLLLFNSDFYWKLNNRCSSDQGDSSENNQPSGPRNVVWYFSKKIFAQGCTQIVRCNKKCRLIRAAPNHLLVTEGNLQLDFFYLREIPETYFYTLFNHTHWFCLF